MSEKDLKLTDNLAVDRTRFASERSLMAWLRTSLSMIAFGFTLYKFMQFMGDQSKVATLRPNSPRNLALGLIGIGTFALIAAIVQHRKYVRTLGVIHASKTWDLAFIVACLLALLGLLMFGSVLLSAGPLG
jgi:putative membrane protein